MLCINGSVILSGFLKFKMLLLLDGSLQLLLHFVHVQLLLGILDTVNNSMTMLTVTITKTSGCGQIITEIINNRKLQ